MENNFLEVVVDLMFFFNIETKKLSRNAPISDFADSSKWWDAPTLGCRKTDSNPTFIFLIFGLHKTHLWIL